MVLTVQKSSFIPLKEEKNMANRRETFIAKIKNAEC
jgi:hypothetical protein